MVQMNLELKEVSIKVVYYGPALSGLDPLSVRSHRVYAGAKAVTDAWVGLAKILPYNYFLSYGQSPAINPA